MTLLLLCVSSGYATEFASVNFEIIEEDLKEYVLRKPEYQETFKTLEDRQCVMPEIKTDEDGKIYMDGMQKKMQAQMSQSKLEERLELVLKRELYHVIKELGLEYTFIYDTGAEEDIFFSSVEVDDITSKIKQALYDLLASGESERELEKEQPN